MHLFYNVALFFFSDFQRFYLGFHVAIMVGSNVMGLFESAPQKLIIDTDAGVDDALAIMMAAAAHREGKVSILAITCIHGNTDIDNVTRNVFLTLEAVGSLQVRKYTPVYNMLTVLGFTILNNLHHCTKQLSSSQGKQITLRRIKFLSEKGYNLVYWFLTVELRLEIRLLYQSSMILI